MNFTLNSECSSQRHAFPNLRKSGEAPCKPTLKPKYLQNLAFSLSDYKKIRIQGYKTTVSSLHLSKIWPKLNSLQTGATSTWSVRIPQLSSGKLTTEDKTVKMTEETM